MSPEVGMCAICAWRNTCQKKFSMSGKEMRCPDFTKDISIKETQDKDGNEKEEARA